MATLPRGRVAGALNSNVPAMEGAGFNKLNVAIG
jgi:hypothetical protein